MRDLGVTIRRLTEGRVVSGDRRQVFIEMAIARAISTTLQLPTSPLMDGSFTSHYVNLHAANVKDALSVINENFIISVKDVAELTMKLYRLRYNLVFEPTEKLTLALFTQMSVIDDTLIPQRIIDVMKEAQDDNEFRIEMTRLMGDIMRGIQESAKQESPGQQEDKSVF